MMSDRRSLTARLPTYSAAQHFLRIVEGMSAGSLIKMRDDIFEQVGNPQEPVNWSDPRQWIPERLCGDSQSIALRLWNESDNSINPRYFAGLWSLCEKHKLLVYPFDKMTLTDAGKLFLNEDLEQLARMDDYDGILVILSEIAARGPAQRKHILAAFRHFCNTYTTWRTDGSVKSALSYRLENLLQRDLIEKSGQSYRITIFGFDYLERYGALTIDDKRMTSGEHDTSPVPRKNQVNSIFQLAAHQRVVAREQLEHYLRSMDPYQFEHLIKLLLEEMGYENVKVTGGSGDKGVDVVANIQLGISSVREVVQVKRQQGNIRRPILDQLRGALHYFNAVRGTIITIGGFSKGTTEAAFLPGAPPITLIDGERLLDLLIEKGIGVHTREIRILEFDAESLSQFDTEPEPDL